MNRGGERCHRVLTVGKGREAAYSRVCRVELVLSASATCAAPSALRALCLKLQTGVERRRQRVLTVGKHVIGGVLERLEGLVLLEALGQMLGGLRVQSVEAEAANKGNIGVSAGADGREMGMGGVLERCAGGERESTQGVRVCADRFRHAAAGYWRLCVERRQQT